MTRTRTIHLDGTQQSGPLHRSSCGYWNVAVTNDATEVSCKACLAILCGKRPNGRPHALSGAQTASTFANELHSSLSAAPALAPTAGAPPRLTAPLWQASCRGAEHRRCGECELCLWEREATKWDAARPWNKTHQVKRPESAPRWPSLAAALVALAEWEWHDRHSPSAMGGILKRIESGEVGDGGRSRPDDPLMHRAGELVAVRKALERAYPEGGHAVLSSAACKVVLMVRTPGVLSAVPTYEELAGELGVAVGELRAVVRHGRAVVLEELARRGLIALALVGRKRRGVEQASVMRMSVQTADCAA